MGFHAIGQDHLELTKESIIGNILLVLQVFDFDCYVVLQHLKQLLGCWKLEVHWVMIVSIAL
jgi:hypothetical protein